MPKPKILTVSQSAINTFEKCQMAYYQRYVLGIQRKDKSVPLSRGTILHAYFEGYYGGLKDGMAPQDAHVNALILMDTIAEHELEMFRTVATLLNDPAQYDEFLDLPNACRRIAQRYYVARGLADAERYKVLFVEEKVLVTVHDSIQSVGVIDMVTEDRGSGLVKIWEHKTTANVPPTEVRLIDLQTLLYSAKLEAIHDLVAQGITWNYVRTKEPSIPQILKKSGEVSVRKDIDSTWPVFSEAVLEAGGDPDDTRYVELKTRLLPRENDVFFPRLEHMTIMDVDFVLNNYTNAAIEIKQKISSWERGDKEPRMHLSRDCRWCEFSQLCMTRLTGGDIEDIIRLRYKRRGESTAVQVQDDDLSERRKEATL